MWWNLTLFLLCFGGENPYYIESTEIYQPLFRPQAALASSGELFLLSTDPPSILVYDNHGHLVRTIGKNGRGPGEFTRPRFIFLDESLFVVEANRFHIFSLDGSHQSTSRFPDRGIYAKVSGGWTAKVTSLSLDQGEILGFDGSFNSKRVLAKWGEDETPRAGPADASKILDHHTLFQERAFFLIGPNAERAYFRAPFANEILIFDTKEFLLLNTIHVEAPRVRIPDQYVEGYLEKSKERWRRRGTSPPNYEIPKYFPIISHMEVGEDGILIVLSPDPKNPTGNQVRYFSQDGSSAKGILSPEAAFRVVGLKDGLAYVSMFEDDEEVKIARIPLNQVNAFVARTPITFFSD